MKGKELTLKEIQEISLCILKDVDLFCQNNNIHYSLAYGTLLGAIRHKGFIPWDDDIDIFMPRSDFERFCKSYQSSENYKLIPPGNKSLLSFARVCETEKTLVDDTIYPWTTIRHGVWIDVFPLDGAENNINRLNKRAKKLKNFKSGLSDIEIRKEILLQK